MSGDAGASYSLTLELKVEGANADVHASLDLPTLTIVQVMVADFIARFGKADTGPQQIIITLASR